LFSRKLIGCHGRYYVRVTRVCVLIVELLAGQRLARVNVEHRDDGRPCFRRRRRHGSAPAQKVATRARMSPHWQRKASCLCGRAGRRGLPLLRPKGPFSRHLWCSFGASSNCSHEVASSLRSFVLSSQAKMMPNHISIICQRPLGRIDNVALKRWVLFTVE
jgi:hypothetical protein